jgi:hypothetical protein
MTKSRLRSPPLARAAGGYSIIGTAGADALCAMCPNRATLLTMKKNGPISGLHLLVAALAHPGVVEDLADPLIGLAITAVILKITWDSWQTIYGHGRSWTGGTSSDRDIMATSDQIGETAAKPFEP